MYPNRFFTTSFRDSFKRALDFSPFRVDFWLIFGGYFWEYFSSIFGRLFDLDFRPLFGPRSVCDLLVLRHFLAFEGGLAPVFRWVFDRPFGHDFATFHLSRVAVRY
jgi:hypothetical protein